MSKYLISFLINSILNYLIKENKGCFTYLKSVKLIISKKILFCNQV
jgi:hypothetical protein